MASSPTVTSPRRPHSRALRRTIIVVLSLLVLLLVVDRGGDLVAENLAASKLQSSQNLPHKPDVDISGFPFLTQFASGKYDEVTVETTDVPLGNNTLILSKVHVELDDMTVSDNFSDVHVDHASAVATVNYDDLGTALGVELKYVGDGKVRASKKITLFGQTITPTITAKASLAGGALEFAATQANGLGPLAGELVRVASEVFGANVPLQGIPFDVSVKSAMLTADGLQIDFVGADLTYRS